jgi:hypothetical protein
LDDFCNWKLGEMSTKVILNYGGKPGFNGEMGNHGVSPPHASSGSNGIFGINGGNGKNGKS